MRPTKDNLIVVSIYLPAVFGLVTTMKLSQHVPANSGAWPEAVQRAWFPFRFPFSTGI